MIRSVLGRIAGFVFGVILASFGVALAITLALFVRSEYERHEEIQDHIYEQQLARWYNQQGTPEYLDPDYVPSSDPTPQYCRIYQMTYYQIRSCS